MTTRTKIALCIVLFIAFIVFMVWLGTPEPRHKCIDPDHTSCDGLCECDGMECIY